MTLLFKKVKANQPPKPDIPEVSCPFPFALNPVLKNEFLSFASNPAYQWVDWAAKVSSVSLY